MLECRRTRKLMREWLAGTLDAAGRETLERHAAACPACREEWRGLREVVMGTEEKSTPDPGPDYWDRYWDRLQARVTSEAPLESVRKAAGPAVFGGRRRLYLRLALPSAAAALILAGILIGRWSVRPLRPSGPGVANIVQASDLDVRTDRYLDRSKRILLALVNDVPADKDVYGLDLPARKSASRALVREASDLRGDLGKARKRRLERLVSDLQTILMQIANLKAEAGLEDVDIIRSGIQGRDLIFQINLARMRGASGTPSPTPEGSPKTPVRTF
jgi:hypothetical protein